MIYGLSGASVPGTLPYAGPINGAANATNFPPPFLYAICYIESINGEVIGLWPSAANVVSGDGGHGLGQLTASYPQNWEDPSTNGLYAVRVFLQPAVDYWHGLENLVGDDLLRAVAATYNAGLGGAKAGHAQGDVDLYTTGNNYGARCLTVYTALVGGAATTAALTAALGAVP